MEPTCQADSISQNTYFFTFTGNFGLGCFTGGLFFICSNITSIALSSCGSLPLATSPGIYSTSMSGGVPTFSHIQPSSANKPRLGEVTNPPSISSG